ncbi:hypothetical protein OS42_47300 [Dickeya oryzae]
MEYPALKQCDIMLGQRIILMGVSGSGKSSVSIQLAREINAKFIDGGNDHCTQ